MTNFNPSYVSCQIRVRVDGGSGHVVLPGKVLHVLDEGHDGLELFVGFSQCGLELSVSVDQALDLVQSVNNEHVNQIFARSVEPIIEGLKI